MSEDYIIEKIEKGPEGEKSETYSVHSQYRSGSGFSLKTKIKIWAFLLGGIALGVILFLFFLTAFIYLFIPILIVFTLWNLFRPKR